MFKLIAQWFRRQLRRAAIILAIALVIFAAGGYSYYRFAQWQEQMNVDQLKVGDVIEINGLGTNQDFESGPVNYLHATRLRDNVRIDVPTHLVTSDMVANYKSGGHLMFLDGRLESITVTRNQAHAALPPNMDGVPVKKGKAEKGVSLLRSQSVPDEISFERN